MKSPAFQWYPKDILASARVQEMTLAEEGAYRRLLDFCWINGSVPSDKNRCARLIGKGATPEMAKYVLEMFTPDPNDPERMIHDRLEAERTKQEKNSEVKKKASEARWNKQGKIDENGKLGKPADVRGKQDEADNQSGKQVKSRSDANAMHMHTNTNAPALQTQSIAIASAIASSFTSKYLLRRTGEEFNSIPDMLNRRSSQLLESLKMKYGDVKFLEALNDFSSLHAGKDWEDEDDLRKHFKAYVDKYANRKQESKIVNGQENGTANQVYQSKGKFTVNDK